MLDPAKPVPVNRFVWRNPGTETFRTEEFMSSPTPYWYRDKPVYVLTSARTFSGGEAVAYDMQALKLATVVGETTGGGANPGGMAPMTPRFRDVHAGRARREPDDGHELGGRRREARCRSVGGRRVEGRARLLGHATDKTEIDALSEARLFEPRSTANPLSEATIRRTADELARGEPNYDLMTPRHAGGDGAQLPQLQQSSNRWARSSP